MRPLASAAFLLALTAGSAHAFNQEVSGGLVEIRHGHGELVRRAALGTPFEGQVERLVRAQREQDFPGIGPDGPGPGDVWTLVVAGYDPDEQKKHFLRRYSGLPAWRAVTQPLERDWAEAVGYVRQELMAAYRGPVAAEPEPLGRVLHAVQDSFSTAHVTRSAEGRIRAMTYYPARDGHGLTDARDAIVSASGDLKPEALQAIAASRDLLLGYARWRTADEPAFSCWVEAYLERHLALDSEPQRD